MHPILLYIGYFGPRILLIISIFLVLANKLLVFGLIIGTLINYVINADLKMLYHEPRPSSTYHYISTPSFSEKTKNVKELGIQENGMPSGHSQQVWFLTSFIYFSLKKLSITLFFICISLITSIQRILYKNHTTRQVIVGGIVGITFGYLLHVILTNSQSYIPLSSFSDS